MRIDVTNAVSSNIVAARADGMGLSMAEARQIVTAALHGGVSRAELADANRALDGYRVSHGLDESITPEGLRMAAYAMSTDNPQRAELLSMANALASLRFVRDELSDAHRSQPQSTDVRAIATSPVRFDRELSAFFSTSRNALALSSGRTFGPDEWALVRNAPPERRDELCRQLSGGSISSCDELQRAVAQTLARYGGQTVTNQTLPSA